MVERVSSNAAGSLDRLIPAGPSRRTDTSTADTGFASALREQLERVSSMQTEAETGIQNLLTGQTQNVTEVFAAARKAEVAFSLLMEIRNKLTDAYSELKSIQA